MDPIERMATGQWLVPDSSERLKRVRDWSASRRLATLLAEARRCEQARARLSEIDHVATVCGRALMVHHPPRDPVLLINWLFDAFVSQRMEVRRLERAAQITVDLRDPHVEPSGPRVG